MHRYMIPVNHPLSFHRHLVMKIDVSHGEHLDKLSILELKLVRISDEEKLLNIRKEHSLLKPLAAEIIKTAGDLYDRLAEVNSELWEIEDRIRELEARQDFSDAFTTVARSVYRLNDERSQVKREINRQTGSNLIEEKSYAGG